MCNKSGEFYNRGYQQQDADKRLYSEVGVKGIWANFTRWTKQQRSMKNVHSQIEQTKQIQTCQTTGGNTKGDKLYRKP